MGTTPVCQITAAGMVRPAFADCLAYVQATYRGIYGQDVYLGADCQDGQFMSLLANAIHDVNGETLAVFNAYSPASAQGAGLSSNVKINGIRRKSATYSTVDLLIVGQVGSIIREGRVRDDAGTMWALPDEVIVPHSGQILVTGTALTIGAVTAPVGTITSIATPTFGWQSVTNTEAATPGLPVETDLQLRQRQTISTGIPAKSVLDGLAGALSAIRGVTALRLYENDTNIPDANGLPGHTVSAVIEGGDVSDIAGVMTLKKGTGVGMYGDVTQIVVDAYGIPHAIGFFRSRLIKVAVYIRLRPLRGYTVDVEAQIRQAVAAWVNGLGIGTSLSLSRVYDPANLDQGPDSAAFEVLPNGILATRDGREPQRATDLTAAFNERFVCDPVDVNIRTVLP